MLTVLDDNEKPMHTLGKDSWRSPRKIDGAMAAVLAWEARGDALPPATSTCSSSPSSSPRNPSLRASSPVRRFLPQQWSRRVLHPRWARCPNPKEGQMATKTKAAPRTAAKKRAPKKPVEIESFTVDADQSGATFVINGVAHTLSVQDFLGVRRAINDQAAGLVH
jgi:hypothetical protein